MMEDTNEYAVWDDAPTIPEYYRGKTIFLTGFTGFMGKLIVEKLLWSCPDLKVIYILVRSKRDKSAQQRVDEIISQPVFDRLRERGDPFMDRLVHLEGDTTLPELGLSEVDKVKMMNVNVIFHGAASVRFDDSLMKAFEINTKGVLRVLDLAVKMNNLQCFVHVSTAYVNCHLVNQDIQEKLYPLPLDWRQAVKDFDTFDPSLMSIFSYKYMDGMPNTYVFTKRIAEHIVADYSDKIPCCIMRPTIVIPPSIEPVLGWVENMNGPVGLMLGNATGLVRYLLVDNNVKSDFMPSDIINRFIITLPWLTAYRKIPKNLDVFNGGANDISFTWKEVAEAGGKELDKFPLKIAMWSISTIFITSKFWYTLNSVLYHIIPAIFLDGLLKLSGKKPRVWSLQIKIYTAMLALSYFTTNVFTFANDKMMKTSLCIKRKDFQQFHYFKDVADPSLFFKYAIPMARKHILKQRDDDHDFARKKMKVLIILDRTVKTIFWVFVIWKMYQYNVHIAIPKLLYDSMVTLLLGACNFSKFIMSQCV